MSMPTTSNLGQEPVENPSHTALASELRAAIRRTARRLRTEAPVTEVTPSQYSVLSALKHGPSTVSALAEREHVSPPAITRSVVALESRGLVQRINDPSDRRHVVVSLCPEGMDIIEQSRVRKTEWLEDRLADLDEQELHTLAAAAQILSRISTQ